MASPAEARAALARVPARRIAAVGIEIPPFDADGVVARADGGELVLWDAPAVAAAPAESVVALGRVGVVEAAGLERFGRVRAEARRILAEIVAIGSARPRLFGGFSFEPDDGEDETWSSFGAASFVLPAIVLEQSDGAARATVFGRAGELAQEGFVEAALDRALGRAGKPPARLASVVSHDAELGRGDDDEAFARMTEAALAEIARGSMEKVVLARRSRVERSTGASAASVVARLAGETGATRFAFARGGKTFLGATPEMLISVEGRRVHTEALAGTIPRRGRDEEEIAALRASDKDAREHAFARDAIVAALAPVVTDLELASKPAVRTMRHVHHLVSPIVARLGDSAHVLDLADRLHPTPAMAGWPTARARRFIREHEAWSRGWYASPVGWFDREGNGRLAVGIRSALVDDRGAWVFAGAGVVSGSSPAAECAETRVKQRGMFRALGVEA